MIEEIVKRVVSKETTAVEEVTRALERAKEKEEYRAFVCLTEKRAIEEAEKLDERIKKGEKVGRLAGVVYALEDVFLDYGAPMTAASKMLENFNAPLQATVVKKLEAEGAICLGRVNPSLLVCDEKKESITKPTLDPYDKTRTISGTAAAVALGIVPFALGCDTGGSVRQSASHGGLVGFKPTYGAISRFGVATLGSSTDSVGCVATISEDVEVVMSAISGIDGRDSTTLPDFFVIEKELPKKLRVGLVRELMTDDVDSEIRGAVEKYADKLKKAGHDVAEVSLPAVEYGLMAHQVIVSAEASSNLGRYDGVRYGFCDDKVKTVSDLYVLNRTGGLTPEEKRRTMVGNYMVLKETYEKFFVKAGKVRTVIIDELDEAFGKFDVLLGPVVLNSAPKLGSGIGDPMEVYKGDFATVVANLAGLPAVSVPAGETKDGLPIGVQLIGARKADMAVLALAREGEKA